MAFIDIVNAFNKLPWEKVNEAMAHYWLPVEKSGAELPKQVEHRVAGGTASGRTRISAAIGHRSATVEHR